MYQTIFLILGGALAYGVFSFISGLNKNIAAARRAGLPYWVLPVSPWNRAGQLTQGIWVPIFKCLPSRFWEDISPVLERDWQYNHNHQVFAKVGETFLLVSPGQITVYTENAEALHQITSKREAFPKPLDAYAILGQYGPNVVTLEGPAWRQHRKIMSASFNEKNAALVFGESIRQAKGMIDLWLGEDGVGNKTFTTLEKDTASLMLNIIANIGFGLKILWPGQEWPSDADPRLAKYATRDAPDGHTMSFVNALATTLDYLILLLITPKWLLKIVPSKRAKQALEAEINFVGYLHEFLREKIEDVRRGHVNEQGMDIMGSLVRTTYGDEDATGAVKKGVQTRALSDDEIIGNAFINIVAGHESTANVMHFSLAYLATHPTSQRRLQKDVDEIFGNLEPSLWDYEKHMNALQASMVGACVNETLRLVPPVVDIPKMVSPTADQPIVIDGVSHLLPRSSMIGMVVAASQRNPRYWPTSCPSKITGADTDIDDFVPERWFQSEGKNASETAADGADAEEHGGIAGSDSFRCRRGTFIPFSDGARACLGRRIALVELISSLAVIFQKYSIELAVDEWASDGSVKSMGREEKARVYRKAQDRSRQTINSATSLITLKLHGSEHIPMRLVRRGEERFVNLVDA